MTIQSPLPHRRLVAIGTGKPMCENRKTPQTCVMFLILSLSGRGFDSYIFRQYWKISLVVKHTIGNCEYILVAINGQATPRVRSYSSLSCKSLVQLQPCPPIRVTYNKLSFYVTKLSIIQLVLISD